MKLHQGGRAIDPTVEVPEASSATSVRILITGSRDWGDAASRRLGRGRAAIWTPLDRLRHRYGQVTVFNGKCPSGADLLASEWAEEYQDEGVKEIPFYADWGRFRSKAGPIRNGEMVAADPHMALVFANPCRKRQPWCPPGPHPSHGTADCVKQARAAGIPVHFCPTGLKW